VKRDAEEIAGIIKIITYVPKLLPEFMEN